MVPTFVELLDGARGPLCHGKCWVCLGFSVTQEL